MITRHQIRKFYRLARRLEVLKDVRHRFLKTSLALEYANAVYSHIEPQIVTRADLLQWYGFFREWLNDDEPTLLKVDGAYVHAYITVDEKLYFVDIVTGEVLLGCEEEGSIGLRSDWSDSPYKGGD